MLSEQKRQKRTGIIRVVGEFGPLADRDVCTRKDRSLLKRNEMEASEVRLFEDAGCTRTRAGLLKGFLSAPVCRRN